MIVTHETLVFPQSGFPPKGVAVSAGGLANCWGIECIQLALKLSSRDNGTEALE